MTADQIVDCFDAAGACASRLKKFYHINRSRPTQCKNGALDLINDARFALPAYDIAQRYSETNKPVYQFVFDQANPWQSSSRAHHANDLIHLFGGIDLAHNNGSEDVGHKMRQSWITFANGASPWASGKIYTFGPFGECRALSTDEYSRRRRVACCEYLREIGLAKVNAVFGLLAAGRISLLN